MRAARCHRHGPPNVVQIDHVPDPAASARQVVADVEVASVSYPDVLLVAGGYQARPPLPFVVGGEFAGTISEVGTDVTGFAVGDRLFGVSGFAAVEIAVSLGARVIAAAGSPGRLEFCASLGARCSASISGRSPPTAATCGSETRPSCWTCWPRGGCGHASPPASRSTRCGKRSRRSPTGECSARPLSAWPRAAG